MGNDGGIVWLFVMVLIGGAIYYMLQVSKSKGSDSAGTTLETFLDYVKSIAIKVKSTWKHISEKK